MSGFILVMNSCSSSLSSTMQFAFQETMCSVDGCSKLLKSTAEVTVLNAVSSCCICCNNCIDVCYVVVNVCCGIVWVFWTGGYLLVTAC